MAEKERDVNKKVDPSRVPGARVRRAYGAPRLTHIGRVETVVLGSTGGAPDFPGAAPT